MSSSPGPPTGPDWWSYTSTGLLALAIGVIAAEQTLLALGLILASTAAHIVAMIKLRQLIKRFETERVERLRQYERMIIGD